MAVITRFARKIALATSVALVAALAVAAPKPASADNWQRHGWYGHGYGHGWHGNGYGHGWYGNGYGYNRSSVYFNFGAPAYYPAPVYYPRPVYVAPPPPVYYAPPPPAYYPAPVYGAPSVSFGLTVPIH